MAGKALFPAGETQFFFRCCLDIHSGFIQIQNFCDIGPHLGDVGLQLRALGNHGHIDVTDAIARSGNLLTNNL